MQHRAAPFPDPYPGPQQPAIANPREVPDRPDIAAPREEEANVRAIAGGVLEGLVHPLGRREVRLRDPDPRCTHAKEQVDTPEAPLPSRFGGDHPHIDLTRRARGSIAEFSEVVRRAAAVEYPRPRE